MPELLRPDVYLEEKPGQAIIPAISTSTAGFVGTAERGPLDTPTLITSWANFVATFGSYYSGSYLAYAVKAFFDNGGSRCYVVRINGSGATQAEVTLKDYGGVAVGGAVTSGATAPFNLEPAMTLTGKVDGLGEQTATFNAGRATLAGDSGTGAALSAGAKTMEVRMDGGDWQTISFVGEETQAQVEDAINAQMLGGYAVINGTNIDLTSDLRGTDSRVETRNVDSDIDIKMGIPNNGTSPAGSGNVANIDTVSGAEMETIIEAAFTNGGGVTVSGTGLITITSVTTGGSGSIEITGGTANAVFLYDTSVYSGSASGEEDSVTITTLYPGAYGNDMRASTTVAQTTMDEAGGITGAVTNITVDNASPFDRGDVIMITDGSNTAVAVIQSINLSTKTLNFAESITVTGTITDGADVYTSSQHRLHTQLAADMPSGSNTTATLVSAANARVGQFVTISDGTQLVEVTITGVSGNEITFGAVVLSGAITAALGYVASQEFRLDIYDDGFLAERFAFLSMSDANVQDFVDTRLAGDSNESVFIEAAVNATPTNPDDYKKAPKPIALAVFTGGADGAAATDNDYIGEDLDPPTGVYSFNLVQDVNFAAVPGITTTAVQGALVDYCDGREELVAIVDPPLADDKAEEVRDWRLNTLNKDSSYGALYYPWVKINDPVNSGQVISQPPSGYLAGIWADVASVSGPHVPPANVTLSGVIGLTHDTTDGEHDILNPIGVNVIRAYPGQGIRPMGSRTLQTAQDGKHYINVRRVLNFVKVSLKGALRQYLQAPIDVSLWRRMTITCETFLKNIWRDGMLYPSNDAGAAYFVKIDSENNPTSVINAGRVNVAIGINPPRPAEFIVITLSLMDTVTASEG
jgi:phage tail sheath protein FI